MALINYKFNSKYSLPLYSKYLLINAKNLTSLSYAVTCTCMSLLKYA